MRVIPTAIDGVTIVEPAVHADARGHFLETFHARECADAGLPVEFVQDNESLSRQGVLRGLHLQLRRPQGKLAFGWSVVKSGTSPSMCGPTRRHSESGSASRSRTATSGSST